MYAGKAMKNKINKQIGVEKMTIYNVNLKPKNWTPGIFTVCSIDPGEVNLAIRVERREYLKEIDVISLKSVSVFLFEFINIIGDTDICSYCKLTSYFNSRFDILNQCNIFIVEKQLPINYSKVRINQHIISYILLRFADSEISPVIYDIHPCLKSEIFGFSKKMGEHEIKKKSIEVAEDILTKRGDTMSVYVIENNRNMRGKIKKDDLADTVFQMEAFFKYTGYSDYSPPKRMLLPKEVLRILSEEGK